MKIPESMKDELAAWNGGKGIDVRGWIQGSGNFSLAVGYTTFFCPTFIEFEDYIFAGDEIDIDDESIEIIRNFESQEGSSSKSVESVINHFHISGLHYVGCADISYDKIIVIGKALKEIYEARLSFLFPNKPCTVEFYQPEDPEDLDGYYVTFWQKKHEKEEDKLKT
jgi:hypothetical protein